MDNVRHLTIILFALALAVALILCSGCIRQAAEGECSYDNPQACCEPAAYQQIVCYGAEEPVCCRAYCDPGCMGGGCASEAGYCNACFCPE
jgi:hypothetical protein